LLSVALLSLGVLLLILLRSSFNIDSWLELTAGRQIWQAGIPQHETLTVMAHGARWIDQQWLAQLTSYVLYRIGGLGLVGVVNVALIVAGVAGAVWGARRLGGDFRSIALLLPLALWFVIPAREVRTQAFAIPLFVATTYLLASDSRRSSTRVYWCFPILILWANVHGTVTFGAALVALRGITLAWERRGRLRTSWQDWRRPLMLITIAPLCLLATPYGAQILSYYEATMGNGALKRAVTEWQPLISDPVLTAPFVILAGILVWSLVRGRHRTTLWEKIALIVLAVAAIDALRGTLLFALLALMVLPGALTVASPRRRVRVSPDRHRLNALLSTTVLAALLITAAGTLLRPASYFDGGAQGRHVLDVVRRATDSDPALKVMADMHFADWLLWRDPRLHGRVVVDARFELLPATQIVNLVRWVGVDPGWKEAEKGAQLLVIHSASEGRTLQASLQEPGRRVLFDNGHAVVILRSAQEAG
jgi:hypothetical protein